MSVRYPKIKICGLRLPSDVEAVNEVLPDFTGFIFDPTRRRFIAPDKAEELRRHLDPAIRPVGVFVNAGTQYILDTLSVCHVDMVQLHGQETNEDVDELRAAVSAGTKELLRNPDAVHKEHALYRPFQIVKAFRIDTADDIQRALWSHADVILLDHGAGGTGESFDWSLLRGCGRQFILAGGLGPDNVADAIAKTRPWAVDASSSLETDGHKDPEKVRAFVRAVRGV